MKLKLDRIAKRQSYTIGKLYVDGKYFCDTLEDADRGLDDSMSEEEIKQRKIYGITAIPTGRYKITLDVVSPKFSKYPFYKLECDGKLPRLINVKGYDGILIHVADGPRGAGLVLGCIGIGHNKIKGGLLDGKECFKKLYPILRHAHDKGEEIFIEIK